MKDRRIAKLGECTKGQFYVCSSEIYRLKQELFEERHKTSQLESDLVSLKKKFSDFEQKYMLNPKLQINTAIFICRSVR